MLVSDKNHDARKGFQELTSALANWEFWLGLGWSDIRRRYERTILGPIWSVLNAAFFVAIVGFCYSLLFKIDIDRFLPHLAAGYFIWIFLTSVITESCSIIYANGIVLKTGPIRPASFIMRLIAKHFIVFLHNFVLLIVLAWYFSADISHAPLAIVGMILLLAFVIPLALLVAITCCRFRDVEQVITSVLLVLFFVTPVLWEPGMLDTDRRFIVNFNIFYHFIELIRQPVLSGIPSMMSYLICAGVVLVTGALSLFVQISTRRQLPYWY